MESGRKQLSKKLKNITEGNVKPEFSLTGQKNSLTLFQRDSDLLGWIEPSQTHIFCRDLLSY